MLRETALANAKEQEKGTGPVTVSWVCQPTYHHVLEAINDNMSFEETLPTLCEEIDAENVCTVFAEFFTKHYPNLPSLVDIGLEGFWVDVQNNVPLREYYFDFSHEGLFEKRLTEAGEKAAKAFEEAGWVMQEDEWRVIC